MQDTQQFYEFAATENGKPWGWDHALGTEAEAIKYLGILNKGLVYRNSSKEVVWKFKVCPIELKQIHDEEGWEYFILSEMLKQFLIA